MCVCVFHSLLFSWLLFFLLFAFARQHFSIVRRFMRAECTSPFYCVHFIHLCRSEVAHLLMRRSTATERLLWNWIEFADRCRCRWWWLIMDRLLCSLSVRHKSKLHGEFIHQTSAHFWSWSNALIVSYEDTSSLENSRRNDKLINFSWKSGTNRLLSERSCVRFVDSKMKS